MIVPPLVLVDRIRLTMARKCRAEQGAGLRAGLSIAHSLRGGPAPGRERTKPLTSL